MKLFKTLFIISFQNEISGSFIRYYTIVLKFHAEVKIETKNHIIYQAIIRTGKQHFHFLNLKQESGSGLRRDFFKKSLKVKIQPTKITFSHLRKNFEK